MILGFLLACLPPAAPPDPRASPRAIREDSPAQSQETLQQLGGPFWTGRLRGAPCPGQILLEVRSESRQETFVTLQGNAYTLYFPNVTPVALRYGCDGDGDGVVSPEVVETLRVEKLSSRKFDLSVPDANPSRRVRILTPDQGAALPPTPPPPPDGALPPPDAPPNGPGGASGAPPNGAPAKAVPPTRPDGPPSGIPSTPPGPSTPPVGIPAGPPDIPPAGGPAPG